MGKDDIIGEVSDAGGKEKLLKEGSVEIQFDSKNGAFYNPAQCFNRDISIIIIKTWAEQYIAQEKANMEIHAQRRKKARMIGEVNGKTNEERMENGEIEFRKTCLSAERNDHGFTHSVESLNGRSGITDASEVDQSTTKMDDVKITILEALSATGLRALRYAKEIPNVAKVVANDISLDAYKVIQNNVKICNLNDLVEPKHENAVLAMIESLYNNRKRYDVIDIDPYGSATAFIDSAVQSIANNGLLAITCTDMAVLAGPHRAACWAKYGGMTVPNMPYHQEMALRLVLNTVQTSALRYKRNIEPLVCISVHFYVRVFVKVFNCSKASCTSPEQFSLVYHCPNCKSFSARTISKKKKTPPPSQPNNVSIPINTPLNDDLQNDDEFSEKCNICYSNRQLGGPFYSLPIQNKEFVKRAIEITEETECKTKMQILGMLNLIHKELPTLFYYSISALTNTLRVNQPQLKIVGSAIINAGYQISLTHCTPNCIKTNAPASFIWDVIKTWTKSITPNLKCSEKNVIQSKILSSPIVHNVSLSFNKGVMAVISRDPKHHSYSINGGKNTGPLSRPKRSRNILSDNNKCDTNL